MSIDWKRLPFWFWFIVALVVIIGYKAVTGEW